MEWRKGSQLERTEVLHQRKGVKKGSNRGGKGHWSKTGGKKGGQGRVKGGKVDTRVCFSFGETGHMAANCVKGSWNRILNAVEEDKGDISGDVHQDED